MTEVGADTVSMLELDRHLSKIIKRARREMVVVEYRHKPWVCIVSYDQSSHARQGPHRIPADHPLVRLRELVDIYLDRNAADLRQAAQALALRLAPEMICRALFVQLMYSLASTKSLYENIDYNLLFRHFIGVNLYVSLWPYGDFEHDVEAFARTEFVVGLADFVGDQYLTLPQADTEFCVNHALLHTWRTRGAEHGQTSVFAPYASLQRMAVPVASSVNSAAVVTRRSPEYPAAALQLVQSPKLRLRVVP